MAATATSTATTENWADDPAWAISGVGTASGADGVLVSGVLTPTVSPAWTVSALVGRRIKLDATWYSISANTATTATITSPPADATYAYLLGGAPIAGDACIISDSTIMTLNANTSIASLTAAGNTGYILVVTSQTITITGSGITYGGTLTAGFIRVSANTLTINGPGSGTTVSNTAAGYCILESSTAALTINNSGGTAVSNTGTGRTIRWTGTGALIITATTVASASGGYAISMSAIPVGCGFTGDVVGTGGLAIVTVGGTFLITGNISSTTTPYTGGALQVTGGAVTFDGSISGSGCSLFITAGSLIWSSATRTIASEASGLVSQTGGTFNMSNVTLNNSGNFSIIKTGGTLTLTNTIIRNTSAAAGAACSTSVAGEITAWNAAVAAGNSPILPVVENVWNGTAGYGYSGGLLTPTKVASSIANCTAGNVKNGVVIDDVIGTYIGYEGSGGLTNLPSLIEWPKAIGGAAAPSYGSITVDAAGEGVAIVFQSPRTGTIKYIGWRTGTVTTGGDMLVQLETLTAGLPSGTLVAAGATATVTVANANDELWFTTTLTTPYATTAGETMAAVVKAAAGFAGNLALRRMTTSQPVMTAYSNAFPYLCENAGSWAAVINRCAVMTIGYDDGAGGAVYYEIPLCLPASALTANTGFDSADTPDEIGNKITLPFRARVAGLWASLDADADLSLKLYGPTTRTISVESDNRGATTYGVHYFFFPDSQKEILEANTPYDVTILPGASTISVADFTVDAAAILDMVSGGQTCHWVQYTDGAGRAETTTKRCMSVGLLLDQIDTGISPGKMIGSGVLAKETGANARGGSGTCAKLTPSSTASYGYWLWYVPTTAATEFTLSFYFAKSAAAFNGNLKVSIYDTDQATLLLTSEAVDLSSADTDYHLHTCSGVIPTATGFCLVRVEIENGAVSGSVYIDDMAVA